jgi:arylsulfatase A-like enzyme
VIAGILSIIILRNIFNTLSFNRKYNIILIVSDALRRDALSCYGGDTPTPNIDKLAAMGAIFHNAYSLSNHTIPSVIGLLTSIPPSQFKMDLAYKTSDDVPLLSRQLQAIKYDTRAFLGHWALKDESLGLARGFNTIISLNHKWYLVEYNRILIQLTELKNILPASHLLNAINPVINKIVKTPPDTSAAIVGQIAGYLDTIRRKHFYLWVHLMDPHDPYAPPQRYIKAAVDDKFGPLIDFDGMFSSADSIQDLYLKIRTRQIDLSAKEKSYIKNMYLGEVQYVDECIGILLKSLEKNKLIDNTIIVLTADHGEEFWDHGGFSHGQSFADVLVNIPLIIYHPKYKYIGKIDFPMSQIDLMPTLFEWLKLKPDGGHYGRSIAGLFAGKKIAVNPLFNEEGARNPNTVSLIYQGKYKCLYHFDANTFDFIIKDTYRDYDSPSDKIIQEMRTLCAEYVLRNKEMNKRRIKYNKSYVDKYKDTLRSLGYLK